MTMGAGANCVVVRDAVGVGRTQRFIQQSALLLEIFWDVPEADRWLDRRITSSEG